MISVAFAFLVFPLWSLVAANEPCLAPVCVLHEPCLRKLPPCVRGVKINSTSSWISFSDGLIVGTPKKIKNFNLKNMLMEGSCPITIVVIEREDSSEVRYCDDSHSDLLFAAYREKSMKRRHSTSYKSLEEYVRNNATQHNQEELSLPSLRNTSNLIADTVGKEETPSEIKKESVVSWKSSTTAPVDLEEELLSISNATSPGFQIPAKHSHQPTRPELLKDEEFEKPLEKQDEIILKTVQLGHMFTFALPNPTDSFEILQVTNVWVTITAESITGFTILVSDGQNHSFTLKSSKGDTFVYVLTVQTPKISAVNHEFVTSLENSTLDLGETLAYIFAEAENDTVIFLEADKDHIKWIRGKYLSESLCSSVHSAQFNESASQNFVTHFKTLCAAEGRDIAKIMIVVMIFLMACLPFLCCVWAACRTPSSMRASKYPYAYSTPCDTP